MGLLEAASCAQRPLRVHESKSGVEIEPAGIIDALRPDVASEMAPGRSRSAPVSSPGMRRECFRGKALDAPEQQLLQARVGAHRRSRQQLAPEHGPVRPARP
jgi:hypothetical protein